VLLIFMHGTLFFNTLMIMDAVKFVPAELLDVGPHQWGAGGCKIITKVVAACSSLPQVL